MGHLCDGSPVHHPASLKLRRAGPSRKGTARVHYVYLIEGQDQARYVGCTKDLKLRLKQHNAGQSPHTRKSRPWKLAAYIALPTEAQAIAFERYLKQGSGHAFAQRHFWTKPSD